VTKEDRPWDERPPFCVEKNCEFIINPQSLREKSIDMGYSGCCVGRMKESRNFKYAEAEHKNKFYFCWYTPFKGWVKFLVDKNDLLAMRLCVNTALKKLREGD